MVDGLNNHDIGAALHITESTIKFHINRIFEQIRCERSHSSSSHSLETGFISIVTELTAIFR
ncbi:LuxR C-terminal-related transcriptional regulator [Nostoc sp. 'Lobaria pulmonaria (5183) cyanobiont']|uniref:LuxR C-terminal-related transcriptional regulator n=1 Tax=Nostoc sp. 'Lobaria pulmonaria (5183) cyanobiont' TaxID=1618022 RepID=UPI003FA54074